MFITAITIAVLKPADPAHALGNRIADHLCDIKSSVGIPGHGDRALHVRFAHHQFHVECGIGQLKRFDRPGRSEWALGAAGNGCHRQGQTDQAEQEPLKRAHATMIGRCRAICKSVNQQDAAYAGLP